MAFHSAKGDLSHEHAVRVRREKYKSATKSSKSWFDSQLELANKHEQQRIEKMSDKELAQFLRIKLNSIFGKN